MGSHQPLDAVESVTAVRCDSSGVQIMQLIAAQYLQRTHMNATDSHLSTHRQTDADLLDLIPWRWRVSLNNRDAGREPEISLSAKTGNANIFGTVPTVIDRIEILTANPLFLTTTHSTKVCPNKCDDKRHPEIELQLFWR